MKIGILTLHYARNYGAVLQCYALKKHLESQGHQVSVVNYNNKETRQCNRSLVSLITSTSWKIVRSILFGNKKTKAFRDFRIKKLNLASEKICDETQIKKYAEEQTFDAFIVGSDQVWNSEITQKDPVYFLSFADKQIKLAYAASFGVSNIDNDYGEMINPYLKNLNHISVREKTAKDIISKIDKFDNIKVVLDPVFLLGEEAWEKIASKRLVSDKYVLCYVMPGDKLLEQKIVEIAQKAKKQCGYKIVFVGRKEYSRFKNDGKDMINASPEDFISLIKYADMVVTNSFHGTAFSIIFKKNFYSLTNTALSGKKQLGSRINDLLTKVGLADRIVDVTTTELPGYETDYSIALEKLEIEINESKKFLDKALNTNTL